MNRLFVAYKPSGIGSNKFLYTLKNRYKNKKAGFAGTLDPFAKGVLLVGFGSHTKLFRFLNKTPKVYRATLWLGAQSDSLDTEMIENVDSVPEYSVAEVTKSIQALQGELSYHPPIFSAKKINGVRAYDLARKGKDFTLNTIHSTIYEAKLLHYRHPFVTFEATVSEGTYIRSLGLIIAQNLGLAHGSLSALERLNEEQFFYENEKKLDIKKSLNIPKNEYLGDAANIRLGRKLAIADFKIKQEGTYWLDNGESISVITIKDDTIKYELGRIVC